MIMPVAERNVGSSVCGHPEPEIRGEGSIGSSC
jgi:hypothetical protein